MKDGGYWTSQTNSSLFKGIVSLNDCPPVFRFESVFVLTIQMVFFVGSKMMNSASDPLQVLFRSPSRLVVQWEVQIYSAAWPCGTGNT